MLPNERIHSHQEFRGDIASVRAVEDSIRRTGKYTKGVVMQVSQPIQGEGVPSKVMRELYDVYPSLQTGLGVETDFVVFMGWVLHEPSVAVRFTYDYRSGVAAITIRGGKPDVAKLSAGIPGFQEAFIKLTTGEDKWAKQRENIEKPSSQVGNNPYAITQSKTV